MILVSDNARVASFVAGLIPACDRGWENYTAIGVERDGQLLGGTVYHNWSPESAVIELSSAATSPRWITRESLKGLFGYPFDQLQCRMIVMRVSSRNDHMRSIARRLGCSEYVIKDLRADGEDECVYTLTKTAWRQFIGVK